MREREQRVERARLLAADLVPRGVRTVALTWVDNAGITRVKAVPVSRLEYAAAWGVGMSPVFDVFLIDDSITTSEHVGGPVGDLRLYPDLDRLTPLHAQPGWAWAPVERRTQDDEEYPVCQRTFARRMADRARDAGLELRMAFEIEWFVGTASGEPACHGPAYGMTRLVELSGYADAVLAALDAQGVEVVQFHPEYAPGQLEVSVAAADPVTAADLNVLVRQTIRAVSQQYGHQVSFAPVVVAGDVGSGGHLHFSAWSEDVNLFSGGDGRYGLTGPGESILAGVLDRLPALTAIGAPSPASYLRLVPQQWAAPYQCWGRENREAALRLVTGTVGERDRAANAELKNVDGAANPYLVAGAVTAVATAGLAASGKLPPEVTVDPSLMAEPPPRLPQSVTEAVAALRADDLLPGVLGAPLLESFCAVRTAERELFADSGPQQIADATRWRY